MSELKWNPRNCQSLLGYAEEVHRRCCYQCVYCEYGGPDITFPAWRQLSLEHVIPAKWLDWTAIRGLLHNGFEVSDQEWPKLRRAIEEECCGTACHFCNSVTSQYGRGHEETHRKFLAIFASPELRSHTGPRDREKALLKRITQLRIEVLCEKKSVASQKLILLENEFKRIRANSTGDDQGLI